MNRHNPTIERTSVSGAPVRVYSPGDSARSIPAIFENHGSAVVRLIFTDSGVEPDPDKYVSLPAGKAVEANPGIDVWAYSPSGVSVEVSVSTGVRYVGTIDSSVEASASVMTDQLGVALTQKQLISKMVDLQLVMLRYFAEWQGEKFSIRDGLDI